MLPRAKHGFELDRTLEADTHHVAWLGLCELRLMDDSRWAWLILIPQRVAVEELHELTPLDQAMLTFETNMVAEALKHVTKCAKINSGALGNRVRQLHYHIIARHEGDANWPGPAWGHCGREPYRAENRHRLVETIRKAIAD